MIKASNDLPKKEEMYLKHLDIFLNLKELRSIFKENALFVPTKIRDIFMDEFENKTDGEYIDIP